eukprot:g4024.t1
MLLSLASRRMIMRGGASSSMMRRACERTSGIALVRGERFVSGATTSSDDSGPQFKFGILENATQHIDERSKRSLDMLNASNKEVRDYEIAQAVKEFQRFDGDTGSSEVQVAVLTVKINSIMRHMKGNAKDYHSRHGLDKLVSKRRKLMIHLRKNNFEVYKKVLHRYGLRDIIKQLAENRNRQGKRKIYSRGY